MSYETPLERAASRQDIDIVRQLLDAGVDVHENDEAALVAAAKDPSNLAIGPLLDAGGRASRAAERLDEQGWHPQAAALRRENTNRHAGHEHNPGDAFSGPGL